MYILSRGTYKSTKTEHLLGAPVHIDLAVISSNERKVSLHQVFRGCHRQPLILFSFADYVVWLHVTERYIYIYLYI